MNWSFLLHAWQIRAMSDALSARLAILAAQKKTITYGALARELGCPMGVLTASLEAMMAQDALAGRALRAALCEARLAGGLPARGFFELALDLGVWDGTDAAGFVATQRALLAR